MNPYQEQILDHYEHPRHRGTLDAPTGSATADNPLCGDRLACQVRVQGGTVAEIAFEGSGCAISQAASSLLAEFARGMGVAQLRALGVDDQLKLLGIELSPTRLKCGLLSLEVLQRAIAAHEGGHGSSVSVAPEEE